MNHYPPEMYDEILKDYNYRWGKFNPIPYPTVTNKQEKKSELLPKPIRKLPQLLTTTPPKFSNNKQH